jgi:hypothetical protein
MVNDEARRLPAGDELPDGGLARALRVRRRHLEDEKLGLLGATILAHLKAARDADVKLKQGLAKAEKIDREIGRG